MLITLLISLTLMGGNDLIVKGQWEGVVPDGTESMTWSVLEEMYPKGNESGLEIYQNRKGYSLAVYKDEVVLHNLEVVSITDTGVTISGKVIYGGTRKWHPTKRSILKRLCTGEVELFVQQRDDSINVKYKFNFQGKMIKLVQRMLKLSHERLQEEANRKITEVIEKNLPTIKNKLQEIKKQ